MKAPRTLAFLLPLLLALLWTPTLPAQTWFDINPDQSSLDSSDPDGASGGRTNGLAADPGDSDVFYGATEWGGLYKSTDAGLTWFRLDNHLPVVTWDVEVHPDDSGLVIATSWYDGRATSLAGIQVSIDGGSSWSNVSFASATSANCSSSRRTQPSGFGISIDPDDTDWIFVGTNCGVAISDDAGATWSFVDPTPSVPGANTVWDVIVHDDGIVDVCGQEGHIRSEDRGATWDDAIVPGPLPSGQCSIDVSPYDEDVLLAAAANDVWESDDGGQNWMNLGTPDSRRQGRVPFVEVNERSGGTDRFDLWYGDVRLYRGTCDGDSGQRCPQASTPGGDPPDSTPDGWAGPFTRSVGAHDDVGTVLFDVEEAVDACPTLFSNDGGIYYNTDDGAGCHSPSWEQPDVTPHALWLWTLTGVDRPGAGDEDIYFGNQDNGPFGATDGASGMPSWTNARCCDGFDTAADSTVAPFTTCCLGGRATRLWIGNPGHTSHSEVGEYPPSGLLRSFRFPDSIDDFGGDGDFVVITGNCTVPGEDDDDNGCAEADGGVFITEDISAGDPGWVELGPDTEPPTGGNGICAVKAAMDGGTPSFFTQTGDCRGAPGQLHRFDGTDETAAWSTVPLPVGVTGVLLFDVDPSDPERLFIATPDGSGFRIYLSENGGTDWERLTELETLMTGGGAFPVSNSRGPTIFGLSGYRQVNLVAFDGEDSTVLAAGAVDAGVFVSTDGGEDWQLITDPIDSGNSGVAHLPRPTYAYFDHEPSDRIQVYIGTVGRGVWRYDMPRPPIADADGPYETDEGTAITLDGTGSYDPDGGTLDYDWDPDDAFADDSLVEPSFIDVGDNGEIEVTLTVTDDDAPPTSDSDESTVTVNNVSPSVGTVTTAAIDEGQSASVSATFSDPGWEDTYSGSIDWGTSEFSDSVATVGVDSEGSLGFPDEGTASGSQVYGDNGDFTVTVTVDDDDGGTGSNTGTQTVNNVDPTATIDESGAVDVNGTPTIIASAGEEVDFEGNSTDPGSDDLELTWEWDDGTADTSTDYLVDDPNVDPLPSPSIDPRDVDDLQSHVFGEACFYEVGFNSEDDDGGVSLTDTIAVVITGNADLMRSAGYWRHQYRGNGKVDFDAVRLQCFLDIVGHMSSVFHEVVDASTIALAEAVLDPKGQTTSREQFDRQLLALWLNFANGAIAFDELVDSDGDTVPDATLLAFLSSAEAERLLPATTDARIRFLKDLMEVLNTRDG